MVYFCSFSPLTWLLHFTHAFAFVPLAINTPQRRALSSTQCYGNGGLCCPTAPSLLMSMSSKCPSAASQPCLGSCHLLGTSCRYETLHMLFSEVFPSNAIIWCILQQLRTMYGIHKDSKCPTCILQILHVCQNSNQNNLWVQVRGCLHWPGELEVKPRHRFLLCTKAAPVHVVCKTSAALGTCRGAGTGRVGRF